MQQTLRQLQRELQGHLTEDPGRAPLGGVGVFHCRRPQALRDVPIHQPTAVLVISGRKTMTLGSRRVEVAPGELLLLPGGATVGIGNQPGQRDDYLALAIGFSDQTLELFSRSYGSQTQPTSGAAPWSAPAPAALVAAVSQWLDWCRQHPIDPLVACHRQVEILLLLARAGVANNLLLDRSGHWRERVAKLLALDPGRDWNAAEVSQRLAVGESTLRRYLQQEQTSFREILEETRMVTALSLLQETSWPVGQVAEAVGYLSHSRFSDRFRRRFGLSPAELKRSRESESDQLLSV